MSKSIAAVLVVCMAIVFFGRMDVIQADQKNESQPANTPVFMRAKLASSKRVLEGLVLDDFDMIEKAAREMKTLSEHTHWPHSTDKVYEHFTEKFRQQCDKLARLANNSDRDGTHFTFLALSTTCVDCHGYVRGRFRVTTDKSNPTGPIQLIPTEWDAKPIRRPSQSNDNQ